MIRKPRMKMRAHRPVAVSLAALSCLASAACGSTVQSAGQAGQTGQPGPVAGVSDGLGGTGLSPIGAGTGPAAPAAGSSGLGGVPGVSGGTTSNGPADGSGGGPASAPGTSRNTGDAGGAAPGGAAAVGPQGPGVTANSITIGLTYSVNAGAANEAAGIDGIATGDGRGYQEAIVRDINKAGGIAGRKLTVVWHKTDGLDPSTSDVKAQEACDTFTKDNKVFAMFLPTDIIKRCAQKAGAVVIDDNLSMTAQRTFREFPMYFEPSLMNLDSVALNEVLALQAQNYFTPWDHVNGRPASAGRAKVGVIAIDTPDYQHAVNDVMRPALQRAGYPLDTDNTVFIKSDPSASAAFSSAVLRFRNNGVDHVLLMDYAGGVAYNFLQDAENQKYYPRYGWSTQNFPQYMGENFPKQVIGSMGIGYISTGDLRTQDNPDNGPYSNDARRHCMKVMRDANYTTLNDPSQSNAKSIALLYCNNLYFLKAGIEAGGPTITSATFTEGVNRLGSSWQSTNAFSVSFGPSKHDGAATYRHMVWEPKCACMKYTSGLKRVV